MNFTLNYGANGRFACEIDPARVVALHRAPRGCESLAEQTRAALAAPLDFPPIDQLCIPGDRVVLALDRHTPEAGVIVAGIARALESRGIGPQSLHVIQPVALGGLPQSDPRVVLPAGAREAVGWTIHDPTDERKQAYLATTARGERIYLDRLVTDADVVITVGTIAYDPVLGYRGTSSVLYPGLSTADAIVRGRGEGHSELGPDDERPLRQTIDEVAWLLGTQFSVQVIPAGGTSAAFVLAGASDSVFREGRRRLDELWHVRLDERAQTVVVAVDVDCAGHGWEQLGAALATARNLVVKGGRIVVLSEIDAEPGDGMKILRESRSPRNALLPIRRNAPLDMIPATQLATAADWARVYLLSRIPGDTVEELFMTPLGNEREVQRLLEGETPCAFVESAQHAYGDVRAGR